MRNTETRKIAQKFRKNLRDPYKFNTKSKNRRIAENPENFGTVPKNQNKNFILLSMHTGVFLNSLR